MVSEMTFDPKGPLGPALEIMGHSQWLNRKALGGLVDLMAGKFEELAKRSLEGKDDFKDLLLKFRKRAPLTPTEMISTPLFQSMRAQRNCEHHALVIQHIVPGPIQMSRVDFSKCSIEEQAQIKDWLASVIESYLPDDLIQKHCASTAKSSDAAFEERKKAGLELFEVSKKWDKSDFNTFVSGLKNIEQALANSSNKMIDLTGRYLKVASMSADAKTQFGDMVRMIDTGFRMKFFPDSSSQASSPSQT